MTNEQKTKYLANPNCCPYCDTDDIQCGCMDYGDSQAWSNVRCEACGKEWTDIYTLTDVEAMEVAK